MRTVAFILTEAPEIEPSFHLQIDNPKSQQKDLRTPPKQLLPQAQVKLSAGFAIGLL